MHLKDKRHGFTIVELLIVIVVIAILAAITIVTFNGISQRAQNTKTHSATVAWAKAIHAYRLANSGGWPPGSDWVCLGSGYKWGPSEVAAQGASPNNTQCSNHTSSTIFIEKSNFNTAMSEYVGNTFPTPAMTTAIDTDSSWRRGIMFTAYGGSGTSVSFRVVYGGDVSTCPAVALTTVASRTIIGGNTYCVYGMGDRNDSI